MNSRTCIMACLPAALAVSGLSATTRDNLPPEVLSQLQSIEPEWLTSTLMDMDESFELLINSFDLSDAEQTRLKADLYKRLVLQAAYESSELSKLKDLAALVEQTGDEVEKRALGEKLAQALEGYARSSPLSVANIANQLAAALPPGDADLAFVRLAALLQRRANLQAIRDADVESSAGKKQLLIQARIARRAKESSTGMPLPHLEQIRGAGRLAVTAVGGNAGIEFEAVVGDGVFQRAVGASTPHVSRAPAAPRLDSDLRSQARQGWIKAVQERTRSDRWTDEVRGRANAVLEEFLRRSDPTRLGETESPAVFSALSQEFGQRLEMLSESRS